MHSTELISKKIDIELKETEDINTICCFTGKPITKGIHKKHIVGVNFTDIEYIKYPSDYVSLEVAKCIMPVIPSSNKEGRLNSLRNYSYLATEKELKLLAREDCIEILKNPPSPPFVFAYTYNNKKHTTFKSKITFNTSNIFVTTDINGIIEIKKEIFDLLFPIIQSWYSFEESMKTTETYFTKGEILYGTDNTRNIERYGIERFYKENIVLNKYRNTLILELLTRFVNRENKINI